MKLILSTFFLVLAIGTVKCAKYDVELASVLAKLKSFDLMNDSEAALKTLPLDAFMWLTYIDYGCVEEKLNIQNVDKRQVQDIENLKEFESLSLNNKKLFVAVGNAAKSCSRKSKEFKDAGIHMILTLRAFTAKLIFPDVRLNESRAEECFKWALSRVEPESRLVDRFDANSMNFTTAAYEEHTSIESFRKSQEKQMTKLDIKSCDVDTYEQPATVGYNVMKMFLFSKVVDKISEYREELSESVIKFEADLLDTQMRCLLRDLTEA